MNHSHCCYHGNMRTIPKSSFRKIAIYAAALGLITSVAGCTSTPEAQRPTVVVTYSVLADIVTDLVGDLATVEVIIPNGQDPHDFEPSAKDVETMNNAALIVANGLGLEDNLQQSLDAAEQVGVAVFKISDHVKTQTLLEDGATVTDPHLWLDPLTLSAAIPALAQKLNEVLDTDLTERSAKLQQHLEDISARAATIMTEVSNCTLVTGHEELGYFATRYGCKVIGAIIPSMSTSAEATAGQISDLKTLAAAANVQAIFASVGTPSNVAEQLAQELDIKLVELSTHMLLDGDQYEQFIVRIAQQISDALK